MMFRTILLKMLKPLLIAKEKVITWFTLIVAGGILFVKSLYISTRKTLFVRLYQTIDDLPAWNYGMVLETGDSNYMRKKYKKSKLDFTEEFNDIFIQIIDRHGMDDEYQDSMNKYREILILKCQYIRTRKKKLLNNIKRLQRKLEEYQEKNSNNKSSIEKQVKIMGTYWNDPSLSSKRISISEFMYLKEQYKEEIEAKKKSNGNNI